MGLPGSRFRVPNFSVASMTVSLYSIHKYWIKQQFRRVGSRAQREIRHGWINDMEWGVGMGWHRACPHRCGRTFRTRSVFGGPAGALGAGCRLGGTSCLSIITRCRPGPPGNTGPCGTSCLPSPGWTTDRLAPSGVHGGGCPHGPDLGCHDSGHDVAGCGGWILI